MCNHSNAFMISHNKIIEKHGWIKTVLVAFKRLLHCRNNNVIDSFLFNSVFFSIPAYQRSYFIYSYFNTLFNKPFKPFSIFKR